MRNTALILTTLHLLAACGGGEATLNTEAAPGEPVIVITKPLPGYLPDGTLPPAAEPPLTLSDCKAPRASEEGIAHGKPPVERCP